MRSRWSARLKSFAFLESLAEAIDGTGASTASTAHFGLFFTALFWILLQSIKLGLAYAVMIMPLEGMSSVF